MLLLESAMIERDGVGSSTRRDARPVRLDDEDASVEQMLARPNLEGSRVVSGAYYTYCRCLFDTRPALDRIHEPFSKSLSPELDEDDGQSNVCE